MVGASAERATFHQHDILAVYQGQVWHTELDSIRRKVIRHRILTVSSVRVFNNPNTSLDQLYGTPKDPL